MLQALNDNRKRSIAYAGAFLVKGESGTDPSTGTDSEKSIYDLKGKELLDRLHEVGTLAQVSFLLAIFYNCIKIIYYFEGLKIIFFLY